MTSTGEYPILVVDDETIMREFLGDILTEQGYPVTKVSDGGEAIHELKQKNFQLVITDLKMPGTDGSEVFYHTRKHCPETKVILMTGYSLDNSGQSFLQNGAYGFILKPFDLQQIREIVAKAFRESLAAGSPDAP